VAILPFLKGKYLEYDRYKEQTIDDIFSKEQLKNAKKLEANLFESSIFVNNKNGGFNRQALSLEAQFSPIYGITWQDYDGDGKKDLLLGGNFYESKPEVGSYDASYGLLLKGDDNGAFTSLSSMRSGILVKGAVRDIIPIKHNGTERIIFILNNASPVIFQSNSKIKKGRPEKGSR